VVRCIAPYVWHPFTCKRVGIPINVKANKLNKRSYHAVILIICAIMVVGLRIIDVDQLGVHFFGFRWPIHCVLRHTFGVKCALCGMTHSLCAMARGNIAQALEYHPLGPVLFGFIIFEIVYRIWAIVVSPKRVGVIMRKAHLGLIVLVVCAIFANWAIYLGGRLL
jgi:hypothetical protein